MSAVWSDRGTLLGLDGLRELEERQVVAELVIDIEMKADLVGCSGCRQRAEAQDRMSVDIRDLACFGRPARLVWHKRRWPAAMVTAAPRRGPRGPKRRRPPATAD